MRKRRKQPEQEPTPEPSEEIAAVVQEDEDPGIAEPEQEPEPTPILVPEPPIIYMLWCSECGRVGLHTQNPDDDDCRATPVVIKYKPA